ncbi:regulator of nonsense transcripts 2 [Ciona intestinalis]
MSKEINEPEPGSEPGTTEVTEDSTTANDEQVELEKEQATRLLAEAKERGQKKAAVRASNQNAVNKRPDEDFFRKLDSSLKKNTAFVKKLGKLTEQQRASLENEFNSLNLTRYIQEIVSTLLDAKLKMSDIPCGVHFCSLMHMRYQEFTPQLFQSTKRLFQSRIDDKNSFINNIGKVRTDLRFVAELTVAGIFTDKEGLTLVHSQLREILIVDRERHDLLSVVISLCKHNGEDVAGLVPRKNRSLGDKFGIQLPRSEIFAPEKQKIFYTVLSDYWNSVHDHLLQMHKELQSIDRRNRHILQSKGELHEEKSKEYTDKQAAYTKLLISCNQLADLLDVDVPDLPETVELVQDGESPINIFEPGSSGAELLGEQSVWEDEDQRSFYSNLLDLKVIVPAILFKDVGKGSNKSERGGGRRPGKGKHPANEPKPLGPKPGGKGELAAEELERDLTNLDIGSLEESELAAVQEAMEAGARVTSGAGAEVEVVETGESDEDGDKDAMSMEDDTEDDDVNIGASMKIILENFISSLKNCVNRDLVDKAAQDFCMNMNTRANRKRLARALFNVHRSRLDLLPFYARLAATLNSCIPDVSEHLSLMLLRDFRFHVRKRDQIHIESKVKTVRFIGEMTKFGMIPTTDTLACLKTLTLEFSPHAIEMACALLETCGRFLLRTPTSHLHAKVLLEQLMRKRTNKVLDQRYSTMIDNARYACDPPKTEAVVMKVRPPLHQYIRKLLFRELSKSTVEKILRQIRKLPWNDKEIRSYLVKCLSQSWNIKFNNVHCLASLLAGLIAYHDEVGHHVVDDVLEDIRVGMEINHPRYNQRRVSSIKFLGELYNYRMVESIVIFNVLYSLITFGVSYHPNRQSPYDPPEHLFRIRLVCILLETCGQYFDRGSSKKKLDYFIPYFERYIWFKKSLPYWAALVTPTDDDLETVTNQSRFPVEVDYLVQDTLEPLRPKLKLATSFDEAVEAVAEVEKEMFAKLSKVVPQENIHKLGDIPLESANNNPSTLAPIIEKHSDEFPPLSSEQEEQKETSSQSGGSEEEWESEESDVGEDGREIKEDDTMTEHSEGSVVTNGVRHMPCAEDEDFQKAFDNIMVESIQFRNTTQVMQHDMTVPVNVRKSILQEQSKQKDSSIKFALLTRKGNKPTLRPLRIPISEHLAAGLRDRSQAEERRKQELKQITLSINERQVEEEQHQIDTAYHSKAPPANLNRERRPKYQPPKGAPNADLIFSSGGRR